MDTAKKNEIIGRPQVVPKKEPKAEKEALPAATIDREEIAKALTDAPKGSVLWTSLSENPRKLILSDSNKETAKTIASWDFKLCSSLVRELKDHSLGDKYRYFELLPAKEIAQADRERKAAAREKGPAA